MTIHRTRLGFPAGPGWLVREQVEWVPPDGSMHIGAFSEPVKGVDTNDFAAGYGQLLADRLPGYEEMDLRHVQLFGGRAAVLRRYRHVPAEGVPISQIAAYLVDDGIGHVVTATTASSRFAAIEGDLLAMLAQIELNPTTTAEQRTTPRPATRPSGHSDPSWLPARKAWEATSPGSRIPTPSEIGDLSSDELSALAQLAGGDRFPFIDEIDLADVLSESSPAVLRVARRSLVARGIVRPDGGGTLAVDDDVRNAVVLALAPDLALTLESERDSHVRAAFALDTERAVEIRVLGDGVYRVAVGNASDIVARVAAITDATSATTQARGEPAVASALAIERARAFLRTGDADGAARELPGQPALLDALVHASSFNRVRTVFRSDGVVHGGELLWWQTKAGALWVLEGSGDNGHSTDVEARPVGQSEFYDELVSLLP